MQDLELRRQDEVYLDALGARRIPDPTTAGDFCRRFSATDVHTLIDVINSVRPGVWARQPAAFFDLARIDMDGTLVETDAECKQGIDIAYNGVWGYHPLVVSLVSKERGPMSRNRRSRLNRLERAADMCGDTKPRAEWGRASDEEILDGRSLEELLADSAARGGLTIDDVLFAEALAGEASFARTPTAEAGDDMGNDR